MNILEDTLGSQGLNILGVRPSPDNLKSKLLGVRSGSVRTLLELYKSPRGEVKTIDLAEKLGQHRSTTNTHLIELEEVGVVSRIIEAGTENRIKPTYLYSIADEVDLKELERLFEKFFPYESPIDPPPKYAENNPDQVAMDLKLPVPDIGSHGSPVGPVGQPQEYSSQLERVLKLMAEHIVALQNRVSKLESQLSVPSSPAPDLSDVLKLFSQENLTSGEGQHE